ncbi:L,D-transpeptidase [Microvirga brassicacearum]|uniref:L,D-transpeptidase n=1 Tax=Microvirga brassicacearum TaxID=2580413 RepID=A0A5N3P487_9HYPH|nr:L,D-transpeptidase [Microvirga brassicacearum]KAB0264534.1 L,D-transpeptidase [Microvirga brassicacearum]
MKHPSRRVFLLGLATPAALGGWRITGSQAQPLVARPELGAVYAAVEDLYPVPAVDLSRIGAAFLRANVPYETAEMPGTIVVDPAGHYLYLVGEGGMATRYGVGVGRAGFSWSGMATIGDKQVWPDWYPPKEMFARQPELLEQMSELRSGIGMRGGPGNPLGARALYLWKDNRDTLFRIHGTFEPWTIGKSVSSGCIRMINQDAMHLYGRIDVGTKVVVLSPSKRPRRNNSAARRSS